MTEGSNAKTKGFVERIVPKLMSEGRVPGLSVAIVKEGETIYAEGFGARNVEENLPATPYTLYSIGSVTKSFVALAILQLVEKGKLSLGDPVSSARAPNFRKTLLTVGICDSARGDHTEARA